MARQRKGRVLLSYNGYRITENRHGFTNVEKANGTDSLGNTRWETFRVGCDQFAEGKFRQFYLAVAQALLLRIKRRRKKGGRISND